MIITSHKSLGVADMIMGRFKKKKLKRIPGLYGRKCASARSIDRSLAKIRG